jgi:hypothetical protein
LNQNDAPVVENPVGSRTKERLTLVIIFINDIFSDEDQEDVLTLSVSVEGENTLPAGIEYDEANKKITINSLISLTKFNIEIKATDQAGATAIDMVEVTVDFVTELKEIEKEIYLFPNPANGFLNIEFTNTFKPKNARIYSIDGKLRREINIEIDSKIDIEYLESGLYLIMFQVGNQTIIKKFEKVRNF